MMWRGALLTVGLLACGTTHGPARSAGAGNAGGAGSASKVKDASAAAKGMGDASSVRADAGRSDAIAGPDAAHMPGASACGRDATTCGDGGSTPACDGGPGACAPAQPSEEICDGVDNDLDGNVDENSYLCFHEAPAASIDELITRCPSAATLAAIDADLDIRFEQGPLAVGDEIVCTAAQSGRALSHLQERAYQALIAMRAIHFDQPLPWTDRDLYGWLVEQVQGIRFRDDVGSDHCCDGPPGAIRPYISIAVGGPASVFATDLWAARGGGLYTLVQLYAHEVRHVVEAHTCDGFDKTIGELGALGVVYYLYTFLAYHSDPCFLRPQLPASSKYPGQMFGSGDYLSFMRDEARYVQSHDFCAEPSRPLADPTPVRTCDMPCMPAAEHCNLVDDDCDGKTDEDTEGAACGIDTGECTVGSVTGCDLGLERCNGQGPVQEICSDGLDNDCDGTVDGGGCAACQGTTGQVFNGSVTVFSSADLASIAGIGCITGDLHITTSFTDLSQFSQLQAVGGDLWIYGNSQLPNAMGLSSLRKVGRLFVENNTELLNLRGLETLASVGTVLVNGNGKLQGLDGLSGFTTLTGELDVEQNNLLTSIDGVSMLSQAAGFVVRNNPQLPACGVQKFVQTHGLSCNDCSGNDTAATCGP